MKKLTAIIIAAIILLTLCGCGDKPSVEPGNTSQSSTQSGAAEASRFENKIAFSLDKTHYEQEERIAVTMSFEDVDKDNAVIVIVKSDMPHGLLTPAEDDTEEYRWISDFSEIPFYLWAPEKDGIFDARVYAGGNSEELACVTFTVGSAALPESTAAPQGAQQSGGKVFEFPKREFVPDWAAYTGSGTFVFTNPGGKLDDKTAAMTYVDGANAQDAQAYISTLKDNGLTPDEFFNDEQVDQNGSMIWFGTNADKSFCVSVSYYEAGDEIDDILYNTGKHSYNLLIQVSNYDFMNEF